MKPVVGECPPENIKSGVLYALDGDDAFNVRNEGLRGVRMFGLSSMSGGVRRSFMTSLPRLKAFDIFLGANGWEVSPIVGDEGGFGERRDRLRGV